MRRVLVCASLGVAIAGANAAPVSANRVDRASARKFLTDATTYVRISLSHRLQLTTAVRTFIEHLESFCPGVLAQAPPPIIEHAQGHPPPKGIEGTPAQRTTSQTFLTMALGEVTVVGYAPIRAPALAFANELTHLHWTKPAIANALADFSQSIRATLALSPPDFCADARASAAMGFAAAPSEATQFADAVRATPLVNSERSLIELANMVRPQLVERDLRTLVRFRRLWSRAEPLLRISDATLSRLLRTVFRPHP
jgi:hypothetical protein